MSIKKNSGTEIQVTLVGDKTAIRFRKKDYDQLPESEKKQIQELVNKGVYGFRENARYVYFTFDGDLLNVKHDEKEE